MNIAETLGTAMKNVFANKMRALLTMLGIIIGIGSVIIITSIGAGSSAALKESFSQMGVGRLNVMNRGRDITQSDILTTKDYELLKDHEQVKYISAVLTDSADVKLLDPKETKVANITGATADYKNIVSPTVLYGRYINENDVDMGNKVVVINDSTATKIFGYADETVIGEKISIKTWRGAGKYTVIGVLKNANAEMELQFGDQFPESMVMPLTTLQRLMGTKELSQISMVVKDENIIDTVATEVTNMLDEYHGTTEKYYVQNTMQFMEQINSTTSMITTFISAVAGISLVVGGIGVMNIMLVTVTERTREIGIRKSIGARNKDIRTQFLIEAIILTGAGGLLGLALGIGGGKLVAMFVNVTPVVSIQAVLLAIIMSTAIGIIFGVYPASKAAKLDPIEALRYE